MCVLDVRTKALIRSNVIHEKAFIKHYMRYSMSVGRVHFSLAFSSFGRNSKFVNTKCNLGLTVGKGVCIVSAKIDFSIPD